MKVSAGEHTSEPSNASRERKRTNERRENAERHLHHRTSKTKVSHTSLSCSLSPSWTFLEGTWTFVAPCIQVQILTRVWTVRLRAQRRWRRNREASAGFLPPAERARVVVPRTRTHARVRFPLHERRNFLRVRGREEWLTTERSRRSCAIMVPVW